MFEALRTDSFVGLSKKRARTETRTHYVTFRHAPLAFLSPCDTINLLFIVCAFCPIDCAFCAAWNSCARLNLSKHCATKEIALKRHHSPCTCMAMSSRVDQPLSRHHKRCFEVELTKHTRQLKLTTTSLRTLIGDFT